MTLYNPSKDKMKPLLNVIELQFTLVQNGFVQNNSVWFDSVLKVIKFDFV